MSTAADKARENAARLSKRTAAASETVQTLEPTPAERAEPIRMTLDLAPALYNEFQDWAIGAGRRIGAKISRTEVLRVLIRRLVNDEAFADEVLEVLRQNARRR